MKMLKVKQEGANEVLLNADFIVCIEQKFYSTEITVTYPNSTPRIYVVKANLALIKEELPHKKMLELQVRENEHKLLVNPTFLLSAERKFDSTKIILSCPNSNSELLTFYVCDGVALIEEKLASI